MKKLTFISAVAALTLMGACTNDDDIFRGNSDGMVTFRTSLPDDIGTRAFADGKTAVNLQYVVYNSDRSEILIDKDTILTDKCVDISLPLVAGETYSILFYADAFGNAEERPYKFNHDTGELEVTYDATSTNDDRYDAFYKYKEAFKVEKNMPPQTVKLTRPFAQINIATSDLIQAKKLGIEPGTASVKTLPVYTTLDMFTGKVGGLTDQSVADFKVNNIADGEQVKVSDKLYDNLAMVYVLAPDDAPATFTSVDMTLGAKTNTDALAEAVKTYTNIPYKRNFRTNIVGNLLTANTDWHVEIDDIFGGSLWMGESDEPVQDPNDPDTYYIKTAAQLAGLAKMVNDPSKTWDLLGKKIELAANIDLNNTPWTPIGKTQETPFRGSFDGKGFTISNLNVKSDDAAGLFGYVHNAIDQNKAPVDGTYFRNVKVVNAKVTGAHFVAVIAANLATRMNADVTGNYVENADVIGYVTTIKGELEDANKIGGMFGHLTVNSVNITGNTVQNVRITAGRDAGALSGAISHTSENNGKANTQVEDNNVIDVQITRLPIEKSGNFAELIGRVQDKDKFGEKRIDIGANNIQNVTFVSAPWDGSTEEFYTDVNDADTYLINTAAQLAKLSEMVNAKTNFARKTVKLTVDIDLNGLEWTPIGYSEPGDDGKTIHTAFSGVFDGNNHTISNVKSNISEHPGASSASLFGCVDEGSVKNLKVVGAEFDGRVAEAGALKIKVGVVSGFKFNVDNVHVSNAVMYGNNMMGGVVSSIYGVIRNCSATDVTLIAEPNLENGKYDNGDKIGGIVGQVCEDEQDNVYDCTVTNVKVQGVRDLGGIAGHVNTLNNTKTVSGNTATNVEIVKDWRKLKKDQNYGPIVGRYDPDAVTIDDTNTYSGYTLNTIE